MYPNDALSAWQLAIMAVVVVASLAAWFVGPAAAPRGCPGARVAAQRTGMRRTTSRTDA